MEFVPVLRDLATAPARRCAESSRPPEGTNDFVLLLSLCRSSFVGAVGLKPERASAAPRGRGLGCQPAAEEEAAGRARSKGRDWEPCGGSGGRERAMRACGGLGPPGPVAVAAAVVLLLGVVGPARGSEDIVVGCGGFVKSDVEINYSLIEVSAPRRGPGRSSPCDRGPVAQPVRAAVASPHPPGGCHLLHVLGVLSSLKAPLSAGSPPPRPAPSHPAGVGGSCRGVSCGVGVGGLEVCAQGV